MDPYHASYISAEATINKLPTNYTKAYSVNVNIGENAIDLRVDPYNMTSDEFNAISAKFQGTTSGVKVNI